MVLRAVLHVLKTHFITTHMLTMSSFADKFPPEPLLGMRVAPAHLRSLCKHLSACLRTFIQCHTYQQILTSPHSLNL